MNHQMQNSMCKSLCVHSISATFASACAFVRRWISSHSRAHRPAWSHAISAQYIRSQCKHGSRRRGYSHLNRAKSRHMHAGVICTSISKNTNERTRIHTPERPPRMHVAPLVLITTRTQNAVKGRDTRTHFPVLHAHFSRVPSLLYTSFHFSTHLQVYVRLCVYVCICK
jgi:hypothetical protein